jgi:hypothetical protein
MMIAILFANGVRLLFDNTGAKRIGLVVVGGLGVVGIVALARLFVLERHAGLLRADG